MFGNLLQGFASGITGQRTEITEIQLLDNESLEQVFVSANPMRVSVKEEKRVTKFTVETGEDRNDHVVTLAVEITIDFVVPDDAKNAIEMMRSMFRENRLFTVQCKMGSYPNMLIESFPHDETADMFTGATVPLRFTEWRETAPEYGVITQQQVRNKEHSSTVSRGKQAGSTASEAQESKAKGSILSGVFK